MRSFVTAFRFSLLVVIGLIASNSPGSSRNVFQDAWGVVTDPTGLKATSSELSASVERTLIQLGAFEGKLDYDVQQRLEQVRSILKDVIGGTQATITDATSKMLTLEEKVNGDAIKLIYRIQCASEVVLQDQMQRAFAQLIADLKDANPEARLFGFVPLVNVTASKIKIVDPDKAYFSTKAALLNALDNKVTDDSKAYEILSSYQNLERAAKFARCHYIDQALGIRFAGEVNDLERLSLPWVLIVTPSM